MGRIIAVVLVGVLAAPPAAAGQKPPKPIDWQKLKPGMKIVLTVTAEPPVTERVLFATQSVLFTRKAAPPKLPRRVEELLSIVGPRWPAVLNEGLTCSSERRRVSQDGVFDGDRRLADLADVVRATPRGEALAISEAPHSHVARNVVIVAVAVFFAPIIIFGIGCRGGGC